MRHRLIKDDQIIWTCRAAVQTGHAHMANCAAGRFRSYLYKFSATFATSSGIFQTHCEIIGRMHRRQRVRHRSNVQKVPDATSSVTQLRPAAQSNHLTHFITGGLWENLFIYLPWGDETVITRARAFFFVLHTEIKPQPILQPPQCVKHKKRPTTKASVATEGKKLLRHAHNNSLGNSIAVSA